MSAESISRQTHTELVASTSARNFMAPWQIAFWIILIDVTIFVMLWQPFIGMSLVFLAIAAIYLFVILQTLMAVTLGVSHGRKLFANPNLADVCREEWPTYAILVPLFREANVLTKFVSHIRSLDYPIGKLDVLFLFEENDLETRSRFEAINPPAYCRSIVVPYSLPQTKPKACNIGLYHAMSEFIVVYDAEDRPEADQLKKAVLAFEQSDSNVACVQCKLNFYNPRFNILTKFFALDYTVWFDFLLPGLYRLGAPIPLGGTSNHFRTNQLKEIGGWDPFNVTEDCDLGIRISRMKLQTILLSSVTWEEATSGLGIWVKQRSRWIKGYFQTHIAHMRNPIRLICDIGVVRFILFLGTVGVKSFVQLLNPILWFVILIYVALLATDLYKGVTLYDVIAGHRNIQRNAWKLLYAGAGEDSFLSHISAICFLVGIVLFVYNFVLIGMGFIATRRYGYKDLWAVALLLPIYWGLVSLAAWKALYQLFTNRFYWEKTVHGFDGGPVANDQSGEL